MVDKVTCMYANNVDIKLKTAGSITQKILSITTKTTEKS